MPSFNFDSKDVPETVRHVSSCVGQLRDLPSSVSRPVITLLTLIAILAISASVFWRKPDTLGAILALGVFALGCIVLLVVHSKMYDDPQEVPVTRNETTREVDNETLDS